MSIATRKARLVMELRREGITDRAVLSAVEQVPREAFVPDVFADRAYENSALPVGEGQTISQPYIVALMTQALNVGKRDKVLEVGTGTGYQTAVLARLCRRVYSIERVRSLGLAAKQKLEELGVRNVTTKIGDGYKGWPEQAPFDRILVTAAAPEVPFALVEQLKTGGIMVIPIGGEGAVQDLLRIRRTETGTDSKSLGLVRFVPMQPGESG
jgi:protein-L-isoaspartate(D-aspartate) O-methyltransferase